MTVLPLPEPAPFRVTEYLWAQLDAVEAEIRPWLKGTDFRRGPVTIPEAVQVALVQAYRAGLEEGQAIKSTTSPRALFERYEEGYDAGYEAGSDAASEPPAFSEI